MTRVVSASMKKTAICESERLVIYQRDDWEFVERKKGKEAVVVLAQTSDGRVVLTEQMRHPVAARVIEFPAGLVGDEEDNADAASTARKELEEETGYTCERVELLARGPSSPGITSEIISFYRAVNVTKKGKGGGVGSEDITVHEVHPTELRKWLRTKESDGVMTDLKLWGGLYFLGLR
jgi:ADP-ribose pyrophosphatase